MTLRNVLGLAAAVIVVGAVLVGGRLLLQPAVAEGSGRPQPDPDIFDPRRERIELADYRPTVGRDVIRPIYNPEFVAGDSVDWPADTLVMGVAIDGEAKAYPVNVLNFREMVIDRLRGIPLLVSW